MTVMHLDKTVSIYDISKEDVREEINGLLARAVQSGGVTPYVAYQAVQKILTHIHINLPYTVFLGGDYGIKVWPAEQFGAKMGFKDDGTYVKDMASGYHVYFDYKLGGSGFYFVNCKIVNQAELDELLSKAEHSLAEGVVRNAKRMIRRVKKAITDSGLTKRSRRKALADKIEAKNKVKNDKKIERMNDKNLRTQSGGSIDTPWGKAAHVGGEEDDARDPTGHRRSYFAMGKKEGGGAEKGPYNRSHMQDGEKAWQDRPVRGTSPKVVAARKAYVAKQDKIGWKQFDQDSSRHYAPDALRANITPYAMKKYMGGKTKVYESSAPPNPYDYMEEPETKKTKKKVFKRKNTDDEKIDEMMRGMPSASQVAKETPADPKRKIGTPTPRKKFDKGMMINRATPAAQMKEEQD